MSLDHIGIGLVGYGMIGKVHALAYHEIPLYYPRMLPPLKLAAVCTARQETAPRAASDAGFGAWTTDLNELLARDDVNVVDVCLPNYLHRDVILAALNAGKHVIVDKPLAMNATEAQELAEAASRAGACVGLVFNYRFVPAVLRAQQLIAEGFLGEVYHFYSEYLHGGYQNPNRPMSWRLRRAQSGGGALVDLGAHVIDLMRYLLSEYAEVQATTRTYVTERPAAPGSSQRERVDVDDIAWVQAKMQNGAEGSLMVSRFATGSVDDLNFQIYGERGALRFSLMDANWLYMFDQNAAGEPIGGKRGWTRVETVSNYPGAVVPPARAILGWNRTHAQNIFEFLKALVKNEDPMPGVVDGLRVHQVLDAAYQSAQNGNWIEISTPNN
jgi:predicted dehydrogenase